MSGAPPRAPVPVLFEDRHLIVLTAFNLGHAVATSTAALLAGGLFQLVGAGAAGYVAVFGASTLARACCVFLLMRLQGMPRFVLRAPVLRPVAVPPSAGVMLRPILATVRRRRHASREQGHGVADPGREEW